MSRDLKQSEKAGTQPGSSHADFFTGSHIPTWDWQAWLWLAYWLLATAVLLLFILTIAGWEHGNTVYGLVTFLLWGIAAPFWFMWRGRRRRIHGVARFARRNELDFRYQATQEELEPLLPSLPLFQRGQKRWAKGIMAGKWHGVSFVFMDLTYQVKLNLKAISGVASLAGVDVDGEGNHPETQTVVIFPELPRRLPTFRLVPRGVMQRTLSRVAEKYDELDIAANEEFGRNYLVEGKPADVVARVFSRKVQEFFAKNATWYIECGNARWRSSAPVSSARPPNCHSDSISPWK